MGTALANLGIDTRGRTSGDVKTRCPQCSHLRKNQRDRSLSVNVESGVFFCHHCSWTGMANGVSGRVPYGAPSQPRSYRRPNFTPDPEVALNPKARAWLNERGITDEVIRAAGVAYHQTWMPQHERPVGALAFPYTRGGEVINVKYRDGCKHFRLERDAELLLYGEDSISAGAPLVWCEGELDVLALRVAGEARVVSVPNGAPPPGVRDYASRFDFLATVEDRLAAVPRHLIAVDNDAPGQTLARELVRRLGPARCWLVAWPDGCKDANDVLVKYSADTLRQCIAAARPSPVAGLYEVGDLAEAVYDLYERGLPGGEAPSIAALARLYRVQPGQWTVVTGMPGSGKTALLDWLLVDLAKRVGWRFAVCSPENQPLERHVAQLAQLWTGKPFGTGPTPRMERDELAAALGALRDHFTFLLPPGDEDFSLDGILDLARAAVYRYGVRGVVIDPWNELEHRRPAAMTETEYISRSLTELRRFARAHGVHVWLIAHPTKLARDGNGEYPVPSLYDISGAAHWRNKADMGIVVHRAARTPDAPTQVHVQKVRFRECGQLGMAELYYDPASGHYAAEPWRAAERRVWNGTRDEDDMDSEEEPF